MEQLKEKNRRVLNKLINKSLLRLFTQKIRNKISLKQSLRLKVDSVHLSVFADPPYKQSSQFRLQLQQVGRARLVNASWVSQRPPPGQPARLQHCIVGVAGASGDRTRGAQEGLGFGGSDIRQGRGICGERGRVLCESVSALVEASDVDHVTRT